MLFGFFLILCGILIAIKPVLLSFIVAFILIFLGIVTLEDITKEILTSLSK